MRYEPDSPYEPLGVRPDIFYNKEEKETALGKFFRKFSEAFRILILLGAAVGFAYSIKEFGSTAGLLSIAIMIGLPVAYGVIAYPKLGVIVLMFGAYFIMFLLRIINGYPLGTLMDALQYLLILAFFLKQKYNRNFEMFRSPITVMILIWFAYNILQVGNPTTEARMAWVYTVRTVAVVNLMFFVFTYFIDTVQFLRIIFKVWMGLSLFAAAYAAKQEYFGFFAFEEVGLQDPLVQLLLFINGHWRKFSIFSDPVAFSYNMVASALYCFAIIVSSTSNTKKKIIHGLMLVFFMMAMLYSGTRGAYVLMPVSLGLYMALHISKKTLMIGGIGTVLFLGLIFMPTSNVTLYRFQSAFKPSDDASFNVRANNQKRIAPYILSHPLGGGLGATGVWGVKFAPHSFLASFPPDSGYVRVAVELGWIGLMIFCIWMFITIKEGIKTYFLIKDPELKTYCLAVLLVIFALNFGNYPQEALVQFPSSIYFYLYTAIILVTRRLDREKNGDFAPVKKPLMLRQ
jgi:putative inorganic carbon (hco3(-)) transporter